MDKIKDLYENTEYTIQEIADMLGVAFWKVGGYLHKNYPIEHRLARKSICYRNSKLGNKNPSHGKNGKDSKKFIGDISDGKGYILNLKPDWYTGRKGCKHVFKHSIVMCESMFMSEIPQGFCIHHIDGNKTNNNINNLALMTLGAHSRLHQLERATTSRKT